MSIENSLLEVKQLELAYCRLQTQFEELKGNLHASHQTLEQIITFMSDGLMFVTIDGIISLFNPAAATLTGLSPELLVGLSYSHHFSDRFFGFSMKQNLQHFFGPQRIFLTLNDTIEIEVSTSTIPDKGILLLLRNRSENKTLEKGQDQAERLEELGEMAATMAHEIRNPLGAIEGFTHLLKRDLTEPTHLRMIQSILEGTRAVDHLIREVLDYARPLQLHFAHQNLVALVRETLHLASASTAMGSPIFTTALENYSLLLDREHVRQVLFNLLRNASESGASLITVELNEAGELKIQDNGEGISPKNLRKIFTPFFTTKAQGTGLGLAHSLAIIKAHGGTMEVSSHVGKGTQFVLRFTT